MELQLKDGENDADVRALDREGGPNVGDPRNPASAWILQSVVITFGGVPMECMDCHVNHACRY